MTRARPLAVIFSNGWDHYPALNTDLADDETDPTSKMRGPHEVELGATDRFSSTKINTIKLRLPQVRAGQVRTMEPRVAQIAPAKTDPGKICSIEVTLAEPNTRERHTAEIRLSQRDVGPVATLDSQWPQERPSFEP